MAFLLIFFLLVMAAISVFFSTETLWRTHRTILTNVWDHWHFCSDQCYKNALDYYKNAIGSEGVNTRGLVCSWVCLNCMGGLTH